MAGSPATENYSEAGNNDSSRKTVSLCAWPTPKASDCSGGRTTETTGGGNAHLDKDARLASWNTPRATDGSNGGPNQANGALSADVALAHWTTPQAHDATGRSKGQKEIHGTKHGCACLVRDVALTGWRTPTACSENSLRGRGQDPAKRLAQGHTVNLQDEVTLVGPARLTAFGALLTGSDAQMASGGQLSPAHSRWLMGLPSSWDQAAPLKDGRELKCYAVTATPSTQKPREPS